MSKETRKMLRNLAKEPAPRWIVEMQEHYRRTGMYRPEDLRRLLGDQTEGVRVGPETDFEAAVKEHSSRPN